jgi:hypothetical protein
MGIDDAGGAVEEGDANSRGFNEGRRAVAVWPRDSKRGRLPDASVAEEGGAFDSAPGPLIDF